MAFLELEDLTGSVSVTVFGRQYEQVAELLVPDRIVLLRGKVDVRRRGGADAGDAEVAGILVDQMWSFDDPDPEGWSRNQVVHVLMSGGMNRELLLQVDGVLAQFAGPDAVCLHVEDVDRAWEMDLPRRRVSHSAELMQAVEQLLGSGSYRVEVVRRKAPERKQWTPRATAAPAPEYEPEPEPAPVG
jgi:DNA polymerase-3 subunit alpha